MLDWGLLVKVSDYCAEDRGLILKISTVIIRPPAVTVKNSPKLAIFTVRIYVHCSASVYLKGDSLYLAIY